MNRKKLVHIGALWALAASPLSLSSYLLAQKPAWVGTWATAGLRSGLEVDLRGATLRQIVHVSLGGRRIRACISNAYGDSPLRIVDAHVALQTAGPAIDPTTDKLLTFAGFPDVSIPAGQIRCSDATNYALPPLSNLSVSIYFPDGYGKATFHADKQTVFIAKGNLTSAPRITPARELKGHLFLTAVDVQNGMSTGAVVTLGASITEGTSTPLNTNQRWPDYLARRLIVHGMPIGVLNEGISGNRLLRDGAGSSALNRFHRDVLQTAGVRWVIFSDDPINDLGAAPGTVPAGEIIAGLRNLIDQAHAHGIRFLCSTLTPFEGAGYWTIAKEAEREKINAFLRDPTSGCDAVVDQDEATHDPGHPTRFLNTYDAGDHLHPSVAGMEAIASAVDLNSFSVTAPSAAANAKKQRIAKRQMR